MIILSRLSLGQMLRTAIIATSENGKVKSVAEKYGWDYVNLCCSWHMYHRNRMSVDRVLQYIDKLGYEVHITLHKKGSHKP